jgi:hypothetical protein
MRYSPEEVLEAIKGSVYKWRDIAWQDGVDGGPSDCPLCKLFFHLGCEGCPIYEKTGNKRCVGTPYEDYFYSLGGKKAFAEDEFLFLMRLYYEYKKEHDL